MYKIQHFHWPLGPPRDFEVCPHLRWICRNEWHAFAVWILKDARREKYALDVLGLYRSEAPERDFDLADTGLVGFLLMEDDAEAEDGVYIKFVCSGERRTGPILLEAADRLASARGKRRLRLSPANAWLGQFVYEPLGFTALDSEYTDMIRSVIW